jgi:hypothetical protein
VLGVTVIAVPAIAQAAPIAAGDSAIFTRGPWTSGGTGELNMFVNGSPTSFITFCLQRRETIGFNKPFTVGSVTNYADDKEGNDPISSETAWLYTQARNGTLAGYDHTEPVADMLQRAIWYFENEMTLARPGDNAFVNLANQAVANGFTGIGNVRVANLFYANGRKAQDQLVLNQDPVLFQVPGPAALTVLVPGLAALVFMRRRRVLPRV